MGTIDNLSKEAIKNCIDSAKSNLEKIAILIQFDTPDLYELIREGAEAQNHIANLLVYLKKNEKEN